MNRDTELQLIQRCYDLSNEKTTTLAASESRSDTSRYRCPDKFHQEMEKIHKVQPFPLVHSSEVPENNSYTTSQSPLGNLIISRDSNGQVHVFHNMCRHRGARLLTGESGCSKRITCPYHAWSYTTDGQLASVPGQSHCFPNLDKSENSLLEIPSVEKWGFIWACPKAHQDPEAMLNEFLAGMEPALEWLQLDKLALFKRHTRVWQANWKLVAEGGVETYHFSYAHSGSIGPFFMNNTAAIDALGDHLRVVMPTKVLNDVVGRPEEQQHIRECTHVLYTLFPTSALLVQHDHVDWVYFRPAAVDKTEIRVASLVPADRLASEQAYWQRNHEITIKVLNEDFALGEGVQSSMSSGAMAHIHYGRNEWALKRLNDQVDGLLHG